MIGTKYNSWTILEYLKHDKWGFPDIVRCQCVCGVVKDKCFYEIEKEYSKECEDCFNFSNFSGSRIGKWSVTYKVYIEDHQQWNYRCVCDCGILSNIPGWVLKSGDSMGCLSCSNKLNQIID